MHKKDKDLIIEVLGANAKELNNGKFDTIYDTFYQIDESDDNERNYYLTPLLTTTLLKAGINPLKYMDKVPPYYLIESDITEIVLPNNIKKIDYYSFSLCERLSKIYLSNSLITIEEEAFQGCKSLKQIKIPKSVKYIGKSAFEDTGLDQVVYDGTLEDFRNIDIREGNSKFFLEPTVVIFSNGKKMVRKYTGYGTTDWFEV